MLGQSYGLIGCAGAHRHILERDDEHPVFSSSIMFADDDNLDVPKPTYPMDQQAGIHVGQIAVKYGAVITRYPIVDPEKSSSPRIKSGPATKTPLAAL